MLIDLLNHRRAVRHYSDQPIDADTVRACLEQARLAPSSSNMQLYQFIHVTDAATLLALATACLGQQSATTAQQMVVFVTRQDLSRERARAVMALEADNIRRTSPPENQEKRLANSRAYYGKFLPFMYARCFGLLGVLRKLLFGAVSLFRPLYTDCSEADMRVVVHKSCGLRHLPAGRTGQPPRQTHPRSAARRGNQHDRQLWHPQRRTRHLGRTPPPAVCRGLPPRVKTKFVLRHKSPRCGLFLWTSAVRGRVLKVRECRFVWCAKARLMVGNQRGKRISTRRPCAWFLASCRLSVAPCLSHRLLTMARPRPVPSSSLPSWR